MNTDKHIFKSVLLTSLIIILSIFIVIRLKYNKFILNNQKIITVKQNSNIIENEKISCENAGGRWQVTDTPNNNHFCNMRTSDEGNICTDSSQCESYCQANENIKIGVKTTGKCYGWKETIDGCMREVNNGISDQKWCY